MTGILNKQERVEIRKRIFLHLDGWALIPSIYALHKLNILSHFLKKNKWSLSNLQKITKTNEGYLNVALRILASQGYLDRKTNNEHDEISLELTNTGAQALELVKHYKIFYSLIQSYTIRPKNLMSDSLNIDALEEAWNQLIEFKNDDNSELKTRMAFHMEGILLGPIMVGLGINNKLQDLNENSILSAKNLGIKKSTFNLIVNIFEHLNFINKTNSEIRFNDKGIFYAKRASAYGVTVSYLPTFAQLETLLIGDPNLIWEKTAEGDESHVYRYMNVWGSGGAHGTYFKKIDEIIIEIFNKPINQQPKGIIDVGCGDGTFIHHVYDVICKKTARGKILSKHPLLIVGADYNKKARIATRKKMTEEKISAEVVFGDISDPENLNKMLFEKHGIKLGDLLNTRTFLDHNRIYKKPSKTELTTKSEGAFAYRGRRIPNNELFQNLNNHLKSWAPYLKKFGLLIVELHSIKPKVATSNIGKTLATAYDATHGYTDQYIIEHSCFINAAKHAGLAPIPKYSFKFPDNQKTTVSIQLLKTIK
ncbi:MAG: polyketide synthase [Bacteroidetes bacterium MED-G21]|nr:MAG: polyketide synthase [Bacteroidetes bacterium MED-G21]